MRVDYGILAGFLLAAFVAGLFGAFLLTSFNTPSENDRIREFYEIENAVHVSPHGLRKHLADNSSVIVDLRSQEEYEEEHIITAVNIPAYRDRDHSDYGAVERIVNSFRQLKENNPGKDIVVYCYSTPCMTGRKIGKMLAEHGIFVKHLGIGWNEWRHFWTLWNHEHEWNTTKSEDYIWTGVEPGEFKTNLTGTGCPIEGSYGC